MAESAHNPMLKEDIESDDSCPLDYMSLTTENEKKHDINRISTGNAAVFPELRNPFEHFYVKFRDLNADEKSIDECPSGNWREEDRRAHPAVEVGLKFSF